MVFSVVLRVMNEADVRALFRFGWYVSVVKLHPLTTSQAADVSTRSCASTGASSLYDSVTILGTRDRVVVVRPATSQTHTGSNPLFLLLVQQTYNGL